jgi:hypothetical protein
MRDRAALATNFGNSDGQRMLIVLSYFSGKTAM